MKILYFANHGNTFSDTTEKHITHALRSLGHEVIEEEEKDFDPTRLLSHKADLFLFHKGGENFGIDPERLLQFLTRFTGTKVCWYFDKFYQGREVWAELIAPYVDYFFVTDGSWARRTLHPNVHVLRQGIGQEDTTPGTFNQRQAGDIVFLGSVYGERKRFAESLSEMYKDKFRVVNSSFGRNLYDLCASTKVFVAPVFPQDNFYWSSRVYMILGSGGFLIHPKLEGLKEEFEFGKHLVVYRNGIELAERIDYYLSHDEEREAIRKAGYELVTSRYTYLERVKKMLDVIGIR